MRISGITIPDEKHLAYGLTTVYGIGLSRAKGILDELNIEHTTKPTELSTEQENAVREKWNLFVLREILSEKLLATSSA
ncbi:MAG: 30S ribosomal protein S13 [Parcubacteria bacterium OLB19]|nr:MAG: 30S ribosomal protein S13 [Parcubacteria bacterium OLB19]